MSEPALWSSLKLINYQNAIVDRWRTRTLFAESIWGRHVDFRTVAQKEYYQNMIVICTEKSVEGKDTPAVRGANLEQTVDLRTVATKSTKPSRKQ